MRSLKSIHTIKRDVGLFVAVSAVVLAFAIEWGSPFVRDTSTHPEDQSQPLDLNDANQRSATVFTGIVLRGMQQFILRDSFGRIYTLDDTKRAGRFEGQAVKITGELDHQSKVIHVESIEAVEG